MAIWTIIIVFLSIAMVLNSIFLKDVLSQSMLAYLVLLVALMILYRVLRKKRARRLELLKEQLREFHEENEKLKQDMAESR